MIDWIWRVLLFFFGFFLFKEINFFDLLGVEPTASYSRENGRLTQSEEGYAFLAALIKSAMIALSGVPLILKIAKPKVTKSVRNHQPLAAIEPVRDSLAEEKFFEIAAKEIKTKKTRAGLMAKAFSEVEGDKTKAEALYLKLRVASLFYEQESNDAKTEQADTLSDALASNQLETLVIEDKAVSKPIQKSALNIIIICMFFLLIIGLASMHAISESYTLRLRVNAFLFGN